MSLNSHVRCVFKKLEPGLKRAVCCVMPICVSVRTDSLVSKNKVMMMQVHECSFKKCVFVKIKLMLNLYVVCKDLFILLDCPHVVLVSGSTVKV